MIADTTPIISLMKADKLDLLQKLFGKVMIPEAVFRELTENKNFGREAAVIRTCKYIQVVQVRNQEKVNVLRRTTGLDAGESESIVMTDEHQADLLLIDEQKGRRIAKRMGINITGTIGLLIYGYDNEILTGTEILLCLEKMKACGIRISKPLYDIVIEHIK